MEDSRQSEEVSPKQSCEDGSLTKENRKRRPTNEDGSADLFLKRVRTHGQMRYSKVVLRFGPMAEEYEFPLLPLVMHSVNLRRRLEAMIFVDENVKGCAIDESGRCSGLVIDLLDFPGYDRDILRVVEDICYGIMDDNNNICISNVVRLFIAGEFLEIRSLTNKVFRFLEKISWESCLEVLATFDCKDLPNLGDDPDEEAAPLERGTTYILFEWCMRTTLRKIKVRVCAYNILTMGCSVRCLLRVAELLPPNVATHVYRYVTKDLFGLTMASIAYDQYNDFAPSKAISCHSTRRVSNAASVRPPSFLIHNNEAVTWIEGLPDLLPDILRRSLLVVHLSRLMWFPCPSPIDQVDCDGTFNKPRVSKFQWGFLCALLIEATRLNSLLNSGEVGEKCTRAVQTGLSKEIAFLHKLVSEGIAWVCGGYEQKNAQADFEQDSGHDSDSECESEYISEWHSDLKAFLGSHSDIASVKHSELLSHSLSKRDSHSLSKRDSHLLSRRDTNLHSDSVSKSRWDPVSELYHDFVVLPLIMKLEFHTLLSIVEHLRNLVHSSSIVGVAKVIDSCVHKHHKAGSFTTEQIFTIYKVFPNDARPSHEQLYKTMSTTALSTEHMLELTRILDYDKLPAYIIKKLVEEAHLGWDPAFGKKLVKDCEPRILKTFVEKLYMNQIDNEKRDQELVKLRNELEKIKEELVNLSDRVKSGEGH